MSARLTVVVLFDVGIGDTSQPIAVTLCRPVTLTPVDLTGKTVKFYAVNTAGTEVVAETTTGVTAQGTQTFTADASSNTLTKTGHGLKNGEELFVSSTGALPGGLASSTRYHVINSEDDTFQLATEENGDAIDLTNAGSGTHSYAVVGGVQYDLQTADVASARTLFGYFRVYTGSEFERFPVIAKQLVINVHGNA
jgi:hypothetical protein